MRVLDVATAGPYNLMLLLGLTAALAIACRGARGVRVSAGWLAALGAAVTAGVLGARLLHFDGSAPDGARTILGGVLLGSLALFGSCRILRTDPRHLDSLALALPIGFAIGRVGCLLAGCCFGEPTDLPWGAIYDEHSAAFRVQLAAGLIGPDSPTALPVHPTQLYEALLALGVVVFVPRLRRLVHTPGSLLLAVLVALGAGRVLLETFRARETTAFAGLTEVQWLLAAIVAAGAVMLFARECRRETDRGVSEAGVLRTLAVACVAPVVVLVAGGWLASLDRVLILMAAAPSFAVLAVRALGYLATFEPVLAVPAIVPAAALLIAMQQAADTTTYPRTEWSLGVSFSATQEHEDRVVGFEASDCGGFVDVFEPYEIQRRVGGASVAFTKHTTADRATTIRLRGFAGRERSRSDADASDVRTVTLGGAGTAVTLDFRWVGITGGVAAGRLSGDSLRSDILGTAAVRVGPLEGLHAFGAINDLDPIAHSQSVTRFGVGYGLSNGSAVRAGIWRGEAPFVGGTIAVRGFQLEPSLAFSDDYDFRIGVTRVFR